MNNLAGILKAELGRQARKEARLETQGLKKASTRHRADIASLKRQIGQLEQNVAKLEKLLAKHTPAEKPATPKVAVRFGAKSLRKLRQRLDLSAATLAGILGVSGQTIYNWETGKTRPTEDQIAKIVILRGMSKAEVQARLEQSS